MTQRISSIEKIRYMVLFGVALFLSFFYIVSRPTLVQAGLLLQQAPMENRGSNVNAKSAVSNEYVIIYNKDKDELTINFNGDVNNGNGGITAPITFRFYFNDNDPTKFMDATSQAYPNSGPDIYSNGNYYWPFSRVNGAVGLDDYSRQYRNVAIFRNITSEAAKQGVTLNFDSRQALHVLSTNQNIKFYLRQPIHIYRNANTQTCGYDTAYRYAGNYFMKAVSTTKTSDAVCQIGWQVGLEYVGDANYKPAAGNGESTTAFIFTIDSTTNLPISIYPKEYGHDWDINNPVIEAYGDCGGAKGYHVCRNNSNHHSNWDNRYGHNWKQVIYGYGECGGSYGEYICQNNGNHKTGYWDNRYGHNWETKTYGYGECGGSYGEKVCKNNSNHKTGYWDNRYGHNWKQVIYGYGECGGSCGEYICQNNGNHKTGYWDDRYGHNCSSSYTYKKWGDWQTSDADGGKRYKPCMNTGCSAITGLQYRQAILVRYENANGSWGNWTTVKDEWCNPNSNSPSWVQSATECWQEARANSIQVTTANCRYISVYRQRYKVDLNCYADNELWGNTDGVATCDVYINGSKVSTSATDFYQDVRYGSSYEVKNIVTFGNWIFDGRIPGQTQYSNLTGTVTGGTSITPYFWTTWGVSFDTNKDMYEKMKDRERK